ncbi:MAG: elongation factor G [Acidiferrobacteraceae bacterium]|nr:elongation factor G [Acidiferrobacteraceae bacterium]
MAEYTTSDIRNVAFVGHAGSGKTLLTEALASMAGAIPSMGSIEKGTTLMDFDDLEKKHQHSLSSSLAGFSHNGCQVNLVDTPGAPDFIGSAFSVLPAVETVAIVINAQRGIESTARRMLEWVRDQNQCCMIVINRIDAEDVDLESVYEQVREVAGRECLAINLPANGGTAVVDCFFNPTGESDFSSVAEAHTAIVDQTVEVDEELMATYLEGGEISPEQLHDPFETALREGHLIPVCFTSASSDIGINELLDIISKLLPNPSEGNPPRFINGYGEAGQSIQVSANADDHVLAHVFDVDFDPFVGRQAMIRVHQGTIKKDAQLFVGDARKPIKVNNLASPLGKDMNERARAVPGDIIVLSKIDGVYYDSVLHDSHDEDQIHLQALPLPMPMVGISVAPKTRGDEQKVAEVLNRLTESDPCLRLERNPSANETILRGMGDLHLRIAIERMKEKYKLDVETGKPTIPYRETVTSKSEGHCKHKKQTGGAGQFGEVYLRVEPLARGAGFEFSDEVVGGVIPSQFIPAVEKGVRQLLDGGAFAGFPMQDLRVVVYDGKHHAVDSKEIAFVTAGRKAFIEAVGKAKPVVLEPIVDIEITAPSSSMGDIAGDLSSRRGRVGNTDALPGSMISITGQVPLAEIDDYQSRLKSMTGGEGAYNVEFRSYEPAPSDVQKRLVDAFQRPDED